MSDTKTPQYLKDAAGFCYAYTEHLAKLPHLSPWDGDADERGHATEAKPAKAAGKAAPKA